MGPTRIPILSKSRFLAGLQCHLRLWHQCYNPGLASEVSPLQQAIFDTGHEVERVATRLYPGGLLVEEDYQHHSKAVQTTLAAMNRSQAPAIYEAAFLHDGVRVRADILERLDDGRWNLIEVKSSSSVKGVYLPDVAIQYYVLKGSGLAIARAGILHLNNRYVYDGSQLELETLFSFADLTEQVSAMQEVISLQLDDLKRMLARSDPPQILPSRLCNSPYSCEFWEHCTRETPEFWILELSGIGQDRLNDLAALNIHDIRDIPESFPLSLLQDRIKRCVINQEEYISPALEPELKDVEYPIHFLDFETVGIAIPRHPHTRPYQSLPFQWSDHILFEDGTLEHRAYLCDEDKDPREEFARTLLEALGKRGTTFTYTNYENRFINQLAEHLPHYRDQLLLALDRLKDLQAVIKTHFYHPAFHGSFSLKSVLPALVPDMNYEGLAIQEGNQASLEYLRMVNSSTSHKEKDEIKKALLAYCSHDTIAMVKIREELLKRF